MKFNKTLMYKVLMHPIEAWKKTNPYYFVLALPFLILHICLGILLALILDTVTACKDCGA